MLIVVEEGVKINNLNSFKVLFYSAQSEKFGGAEGGFHEGFLKSVIGFMGTNSFTSGKLSTSTVYVIPKHQDKWISTKSKVALGKAWLKLTKFNSKLCLRIKIFSKQEEAKEIALVPGLAIEFSSDLNNFMPKPNARSLSQSPQPSKKLKLGLLPTEMTSINQLKVQKPYLEWIIDPNHDEPLFPPNSLGALMEANKSLLLKDEFYGRRELPRD